MKQLFIFDCDGTLVQMPERKLFKGIKELLDELQKREISLFLWTMRTRSSSFQLLKELGIMGHFDDFCFGDDIYPKPDVRGLDILDLQFDRIYMVGDGHNDKQGAFNLNATFIAAGWNRDLSSSLRDESVHFVCSSPGEIIEKYL